MAKVDSFGNSIRVHSTAQSAACRSSLRQLDDRVDALDVIIHTDVNEGMALFDCHRSGLGRFQRGVRALGLPIHLEPKSTLKWFVLRRGFRCSVFTLVFLGSSHLGNLLIVAQIPSARRHAFGELPPAQFLCRCCDTGTREGFSKPSVVARVDLADAVWPRGLAGCRAHKRADGTTAAWPIAGPLALRRSVARWKRHPRVIWAVVRSEEASELNPYTRLTLTDMGNRCVGFKAPPFAILIHSAHVGSQSSHLTGGKGLVK